jgi:hypothetical protein
MQFAQKVLKRLMEGATKSIYWVKRGPAYRHASLLITHGIPKTISAKYVTVRTLA